MDWALGALVVGVVVGLTGMGGGALMTPMLVLSCGRCRPSWSGRSADWSSA